MIDISIPAAMRHKRARHALRALAVLALGTLAACNSGHSQTAVGAACDGQASWPQTTLPASDATTVDASEFIISDQLHSWGVELDGRGLRATGSSAHEAYIDAIASRLRCAGVKDIRFESVPLQRWTPQKWTLSASGSELKVAAYVPYSGSTSAAGVTAPVVYLDSKTAAADADVAGKIVLFDEPQSSLPAAGFLLYAQRVYKPLEFGLLDIYTRPYLAQSAFISRLEEIQAAGAVGGIAVSANAYETARGSYYPYDYVFRELPSLFVDKSVGAQLKTVAGSGGSLTLALPAKTDKVNTRNIVAIIPGGSDEITVLHSHSDGTNAIEDNGPDAIVGIAQYLTRLPQSALPRTIMILLTSGHFAGGIGAQAFLETHKDDGLLSRIASITTIEHLGATEWLPDSDGVLQPTGKAELGGIFQPDIKALADVSYAALQNAGTRPGAVLKPLNPSGDGTADNAVWPGEGQYFYGLAHITTANFITGPYYLLNWGGTTTDKIDYDAMRREMIAFAQMQLDVSRVAKSDLSESGD